MHPILIVGKDFACRYTPRYGYAEIVNTADTAFMLGHEPTTQTAFLQGDEAHDLYDTLCRICDDHISDNDTINRRIDLTLDCYL